MTTHLPIGDPAEEALRQEFESLVSALVESVRHTAEDTVEQASGHIHTIAADLRGTSSAIEQTAREARQSMDTVAELTQAVDALRRRVESWEPRLDQLQSRVEKGISELQTTQTRLVEMDRVWQSRTVEAQRRLRWFVLIVNLLLLAGVALLLKYLPGSFIR